MDCQHIHLTKVANMNSTTYGVTSATNSMILT